MQVHAMNRVTCHSSLANRPPQISLRRRRSKADGRRLLARPSERHAVLWLAVVPQQPHVARRTRASKRESDKL